MIHQIYLTERNLLILLQKLYKKRNGEITHCTLIKNDDQHPKYSQTMEHCTITAIEDRDYYIDRQPGKMNEADEKKIRAMKKALNIKKGESK